MPVEIPHVTPWDASIWYYVLVFGEYETSASVWWTVPVYNSRVEPPPRDVSTDGAHQFVAPFGPNNDWVIVTAPLRPDGFFHLQWQTPCPGSALWGTDPHADERFYCVDISSEQFTRVLLEANLMRLQQGKPTIAMDSSKYRLGFFLINAESFSHGDPRAGGMAMSIRDLAVEQIRN